jgi:DNA-binding MarR family transcriptional regulator
MTIPEFLQINPILVRNDISLKLATGLLYLDQCASNKEDCTITKFAEITGHCTAAATDIIDRAEAKGYVMRVDDPSDRRKKLMRLDDKGELLVLVIKSAIKAIKKPV